MPRGWIINLCGIEEVACSQRKLGRCAVQCQRGVHFLREAQDMKASLQLLSGVVSIRCLVATGDAQAMSPSRGFVKDARTGGGTFLRYPLPPSC